jgi:hypothetical protein
LAILVGCGQAPPPAKVQPVNEPGNVPVTILDEDGTPRTITVPWDTPIIPTPVSPSSEPIKIIPSSGKLKKAPQPTEATQLFR